MPHVHPSRPPGATASRSGRSPVLSEREASSIQVPEEEGVELRRTADGKSDGVLAARPFAAGETVMVGFLVGPLTGNDSHATQVGPGRWARHGGLGPKVNHSCDPNCGVRLNDGQAFDFVARQPIGAGQELTFDYAMRNFTIDHFPAVCLCGADTAVQCRWPDILISGATTKPAGRLDQRVRRGRPSSVIHFLYPTPWRTDLYGRDRTLRKSQHGHCAAAQPSITVRLRSGADSARRDDEPVTRRWGAT